MIWRANERRRSLAMTLQGDAHMADKSMGGGKQPPQKGGGGFSGDKKQAGGPGAKPVDVKPDFKGGGGKGGGGKK
jgi:hypothetical protein